MKTYKIAVLDDYQNAALESADWSVLGQRADLTVFKDHLADPEAVIERLMPFDVICVMRERSPLPRNIIERLPNLKLIASTGAGNASIDVAAADERGIAVVHTGYRSDPAIEFTWALILASARHIVTENNSVRSGGWQKTVGADLRGKTLGVLGLGRIGSEVARICETSRYRGDPDASRRSAFHRGVPALLRPVERRWKAARSEPDRPCDRQDANSGARSVTAFIRVALRGPLSAEATATERPLFFEHQSRWRPCAVLR